MRISKYAGLTFLFTCCFISPVISADTAKQNQPITDLRVIIDISGSMKKSDPQNLRRPALRLLAGLIPTGSRAGVWNFGKQVNMVVRIGDVDDAWREQARKQSKEISSVGLFTNIESAMRKASFDWKTPDPHYKRNLILLTDGHVDVGNDEAENKASKSRIIREILPALEKAKVRIHTIALSDDVDETLLSTLSTYSNGLFKKVSSADELQKLFLQMLEQSASLDSVPIKNNTFRVDDSIQDMTLLVFNSDGSSPTKIITPAQQTWTEKKNAKQVKWFRDEGFDLLTVKKPQQGEWKIIAPRDENNRVIVATNLKLKVDDLPGYSMPGDIIDVTAQLLEDGKPLKDQQLLSKFSFSIVRKIEGHAESLYQMSMPGKDDYKSHYLLPSGNVEGLNELIIKAKSPTAERELHHQFRVYNTVANVVISEENGKYRVTVKPYDNLLKPGSINITAILNDKSHYELIQQGEALVVDLDKKYHGTLMNLDLHATRADGKSLSMTFQKEIKMNAGPGVLNIEEKKPVVKDEHNKKDQHSLKDKKTKEVKKEEKKKIKNQEKNKASSTGVNAEVNWTMIVISIVTGNLLLIGIFAGGYLFLKRRKAKMSASLKDEMAEGGDNNE